jgi:hypothetical protein
MPTRLLPFLLVAVALLPASCGGNSGSDAPPAEADQASAGDIPDNQVFLMFNNTKAAYSIKYPEGWAQQGEGDHVTFRDKGNLVRIDVVPGGKVSTDGVIADVERLKQQETSLTFQTPIEVMLHGTRAVKVVYTTAGAENAVTGKRVKLVLDRYVVPGAGKHAVIDLGTPEGVDNVDAYRLMSESFRWQ